MKDSDTYIFLNPDGSQNLGLCLVVEKQTGIFYGNPTSGHATLEIPTEGYLVPLGEKEIEQELKTFFWKELNGWSPDFWTDEQVQQLSSIISKIPCWKTSYKEDDERHFLKLDKTRIEECVEAWVPVKSPLGKAILLFENSD